MDDRPSNIYITTVRPFNCSVKITNNNAIMGPIGFPELIVILIILAILAIPLIIVIGLVWYLMQKKKSQETGTLPDTGQTEQGAGADR